MQRRSGLRDVEVPICDADSTRHHGFIQRNDAVGEWSLVTMAWNIKRMFTLSPA